MTELHKDSSAATNFETVTPEMVDAYLIEARRLRAKAMSEALRSLGRSLFQKADATKSRPSTPVVTRPVGATG
ncbi:MAG: hypothetical protein KTR21_12100 [Rhodobacteraceae bacterium]|nr:hypothetical protein [Paracoccaceae bacterium]